MLRADRQICFRLFVALLALSVVIFPAAGAGAVAHCRAAAKVKLAEATPKLCCAKHTGGGSSQSHDKHVPGSSKCAKCLHTCCSPVVDVVHVTPMLVQERAVVTSHVLPAESVHDPMTCDAIFRPPRA